MKISLRANKSTKAPAGVDREAGAILGVSVAQSGPAKGHGFNLDAETIAQLEEHGNAAGSAGVKVRFTHPDVCDDGLGTAVGRARNFRRVEDGERVLADVYLLEAAASSPKGNLRAYLLDYAEEAPDQFGLSIVAEGEIVVPVDENDEPAVDDETGQPLPKLLRVSRLRAVDFVDSPAANRQGLYGTSLAAMAAELMDETLEELSISEGDRLELEQLAGAATLADLLPAEGLVYGPGRTFHLSSDTSLETAADFLNRYLDRRGIAHENVTAGAVRRILSTDGAQEMDKNTPPAGGTEPAETATSLADGLTQEDVQAQLAAAVAAENERCREIRALATLFPAYDLASVIDSAIRNTETTVDLARKDVLEAIAKQNQSTTPAGGAAGSVEVGASDLERFLDAAEDGILLGAGIIDAEREPDRAEKIRATGLAALGPQMIARNVLRLAGVRDADRLDPMAVWERVHQLDSGVGHGVGDFPLLLANVGNKAVMSGWTLSPVTYPLWTKRGNLSDFKTAKRLRLSEGAMLEERAPGEPARAGSFAERGEDIALDNFARAFSYTRQMFLNDDAGAFADLGSRIGGMARQTIERQVYVLLTSNSGAGPTLEDSVALFHADHSNLATVGTTPTQTTIATAVAAMMTQTGMGDDGASLVVGAPPRFSLSGPTRAMVIESIVKSPNWGSDARRDPQNTKVAAIDPIYVPQLELLAPNAYYFVADQSLAPTCEVAFLNGIDQPRTTTKTGTLVDGTTVVVDLDWGIAFTGGYEGIYRHPGA